MERRNKDMKKRLAITASILAVAVLVAVPLVHAGPGGGHRGGHAGFGMIGGHLRHLAEDLDLTEQQRDQIHAIFKEVHEQNAQYLDSMHDGFKSIAEVLLRNPGDLAGAQALLDQQTAAERAMKANMLTATSKALNVLTAEQRAELAQKIAERGERWERRRR